MLKIQLAKGEKNNETYVLCFTRKLLSGKEQSIPNEI